MGRNILSSTLKIFCIVLFTVGAVEITARYYRKHYLANSPFECGSRFEYDQYAGYKAKANYSCKDVHVNNLNFRGSRHTDVKKQPGVIRIILAGGSAAWGLGTMYPTLAPQYLNISDADTVDAYLEKKLSAKFPRAKFEVLNGSAIGYWSNQHLLRYISFYRTLNPDMIILMDGVNDYFRFGDNFHQFYDHPYRENFTYPIVRPSFYGALMTFSQWLGQYSEFVNLVREGSLARFWDEKVGTLDAQPAEPNLASEEERKSFLFAYREKFTKETLSIYKMLGAILKQDGVPLIVSFQPVLELKTPDDITAHERELYKSNLESRGGETTRKRMLLQANEFDELLDTEARQGTFEYINLHKSIETGKEDLFTDYCHLTPSGNEKIADKYLAQILPFVESKLREH